MLDRPYLRLVWCIHGRLEVVPGGQADGLPDLGHAPLPLLGLLAPQIALEGRVNINLIEGRRFGQKVQGNCRPKLYSHGSANLQPPRQMH